MSSAEMDGRPILVMVARKLREQGLEAVLLGNAAAALQGAPVTTLDLDFLIRKTPLNTKKLKAIAKALDAVLFTPYYPVSGLFRLSRDNDSLQLDFLTSIDGIRTFNGLRKRAIIIDLDGKTLVVAALADIISSKRAADRPWDSDRKPTKREENLAALKRESDLALRDQIRRLLARPAHQLSSQEDRPYGFLSLGHSSGSAKRRTQIFRYLTFVW